MVIAHLDVPVDVTQHVKMAALVLALMLVGVVVVLDAELIVVESALQHVAMLALVAPQHAKQTVVVAVKGIVLDAAQLFLAVVVDVVPDVPADVLEHVLVVVR